MKEIPIFYIWLSLIKIWSHTKNQLLNIPGSALKVCVVARFIHIQLKCFDNCISILEILRHLVSVVTKNASLLEMKAMEMMLTSSWILTLSSQTYGRVC